MQVFFEVFLKKSTRRAAPAPDGAMEGWPPVLCVHHVHSTFPPVGTVHCAEHMVGAWPTGNAGNTKNTGLSTGMRVSHVPWNFRSTWPAVCHRLSIVFPVFIVFIVGLARPLCSAPVFATLRRGKPAPQQRGGAVISQRHDAAPHPVLCTKCPANQPSSLFFSTFFTKSLEKYPQIRYNIPGPLVKLYLNWKENIMKRQ